MSADWTVAVEAPFGAVIASADPGADAAAIPVAAVEGWLDAHRLLVLRGWAPLPGPALPAFARRFGELQEWDFGAVNELAERADARNYLYTNRAVPFHWDGAFAGRSPRWLVFASDAAAGAGGATLFCDAVRLLAEAEPERRALWTAAAATWSTERIAHYGGSFTAPLIGRHARSGAAVLRWAEAVDDLNPVQVAVHGVDAAQVPGLIGDLARRLRDPRWCRRLAWRTGDLVIADNHALLHGREAFASGAPRRLRRVNVL